MCTCMTAKSFIVKALLPDLRTCVPLEVQIIKKKEHSESKDGILIESLYKDGSGQRERAGSVQKEDRLFKTHVICFGSSWEPISNYSFNITFL